MDLHDLDIVKHSSNMNSTKYTSLKENCIL